MTEEQETDDRAFAARFRAAYERTPPPDPDARARVIAAADAPPRRSFARAAGWFEPRAFVARPIAVAAAAVVLVAAGALLALVARPRVPLRVTPAAPAVAAGMTNVRFALADAGAARVALVGDFNGWETAATPMRRDAGGVWRVTVPLRPGWHAYAFVVDGVRWVHDPDAPLAPPDEFGESRSVVVVGGQGT